MSVETILTPAQRDDLKVVAAMIIPASSEYKVPGADDAAIQADMLATLDRDTPMVREALDHLARLAGQPLAGLDAGRRVRRAMSWSRATGRCSIRSRRGRRRCGEPARPATHLRDR
jgi:hypothetical protein